MEAAVDAGPNSGPPESVPAGESAEGVRRAPSRGGGEGEDEGAEGSPLGVKSFERRPREGV